MIIFSKKEKAGNQRRIFHKDTVRQAFWRALPIMGSYLFVSMSYGLLMQEAGYRWGWSLLVSMTVYTGAFQFVLITFLSSGASLLTIGLTALFMNSRQFFYGLSFVEEFRQMGKRYPYMVHTMTDETYAANCALQMQQEQRAKESDQKMGQNEKKAVPEEDEKNIAESRENIRKRDEMFWIALFSRISWMLGAVAGGVIGQSIPVELTGIDFCMTALFVTIFVDQWRSAKSHIPALLGLGCGVVLLLLVGPDYFLLPTLILVSGILLLIRGTMNSAVGAASGEGAVEHE